MKYVIWNTTEKKYVSAPGSKRSYTKFPMRARKFDSREAAQQECCGHEVPRRLINAAAGA